jgi:hypothetical protein
MPVMTDQANESMGATLRQDPSQQPGGDPELEFGPRAPTMPQYFLGYAVVFAVIIGFALAVVGLMRLVR